MLPSFHNSIYILKMGTLIFSIHCTHTVSYNKENVNHEVDLIRTAPLIPILKVQTTLTVNLIFLVGMLAHIHVICTIYNVHILTDHNMLTLLTYLYHIYVLTIYFHIMIPLNQINCLHGKLFKNICKTLIKF